MSKKLVCLGKLRIIEEEKLIPSGPGGAGTTRKFSRCSRTNTVLSPASTGSAWPARRTNDTDLAERVKRWRSCFISARQK